MKYLLGQKLEMSQKFLEDGTVVSVTAIKTAPNTITQIKGEKDGYTAVQVGYGEKRKVTKSLLGHLKGLAQHRFLHEFRVDSTDGLERGKQIAIDSFVAGDKVKVTGISKGRGFQGVVKRHDFSGSLATHGHKDQLRMPGSIGAGGPAHVFRGTRMPGRMGSDQITIKNMEVVEVDAKENIIYLKGALPGARNSFVWLSAEGDLKFTDEHKNESTEEPKNEETQELKNEETEEPKDVSTALDTGETSKAEPKKSETEELEVQANKPEATS